MKKKKNKNTNYYIDTAKYSSSVIETLEEKGGINSKNYNNICNNSIYYIDPVTKEIIFCSKESIVAHLIKSFYTEIKPDKRLNKGEIYYYIVMTAGANIDVKDTIDTRAIFDDITFNAGNYFKTSTEAQIAADKIKAIFNDNK